jgi:hypothetical protein
LYPLVQVQAKLHEEIDRVIGSDRLPTLADRDNLKYTWAVIMEVMRIKVRMPLTSFVNLFPYSPK